MSLAEKIKKDKLDPADVKVAVRNFLRRFPTVNKEYDDRIYALADEEFGVVFTDEYKKAQYYQPEPEPQPYGHTHPVLIIGIIVFVLPFFSTVLKFTIPKFISGVGIFLIIVGAVLSMIKVSDLG